ncbi:MAG: VIT and vWA domain-containing protein [Verrucomicrobiales bacterium]
MKTKNHLLHLLACVVTTHSAQAESEPASPYFHVHGSELTDSFPLKSSHAEVEITGGIARVTLTQSYANLGDTPLDATYLFPASTGASVHGMTMRIGERTLEAKIERKEEAKKQFEQAKKEHKSASLLSQKRPNLFQMDVARILPGDELELTLHYSEILKPRQREERGREPAQPTLQYEFVLPTAIGPRYEGATAPAEQINNPYLTKETSDPTRFSLDLSLKSPLPVKNLACPTHQANIHFLSKNAARLRLAPSAPDRDLIVRYQLAQDEISSGLVLHQGERENHFLLQVEPPRKLRAAEIPAREYLFLVDISGSMRGFPLTLTKKLFRDLTSSLRPIDRFNIVLFAGSNQVLSPQRSLPATPENIEKALRLLDRQSGGGGTELASGLRTALELPGSRDISRSLILITDGQISAERDVFELVSNSVGDTNIFPLGVGSSVNRHLLDGLAHLAGNDSAVVTHASEIASASERFQASISSPVLTGITVTSEGFELGELQPARLPDLFAGRPLSLTGTWTGEPRGTITISGITGGGETYRETLSVAEAAETGRSHPVLPTLWARERVRQLADYAGLKKDPKAIAEVTRIGLQHQLLTPYTSFIAIDHEVRENQEPTTPVKQATTVPHGQSEGPSGAVPEPNAFLLIALTLLTTTFLRVRRT